MNFTLPERLGIMFMLDFIAVVVSSAGHATELNWKELGACNCLVLTL